MWSISRTQADWGDYRVASHIQCVYEDVERVFTERSKSLYTNEPNPQKWWSTVKTAVFGTSSNLPPLLMREVTWSDQQLRKPHCFLRTLMLSSVEIIFCNRIIVTLL